MKIRWIDSQFFRILRQPGITLVFFILTLKTLRAQEIEKAPKIKTFELGYRYNYAVTYSNFPKNGISMVFDYGWQLSGFHKKAAAFISVPFGYTFFTASGSEKKSSLIFYGWTVRHNLTRDKKYIPYFGYHLLLNQLKFKGISGRDIGHETRFEFGYNILLKEKKQLVVKIEYGMIFIPSFNQTKSESMKYFGVKTGYRF